MTINLEIIVVNYKQLLINKYISLKNRNATELPFVDDFNDFIKTAICEIQK